jgi:hypothetical protein
MPHFKEYLDTNFLSNIDFINDNMRYDRKIVTITDVKREVTHNGKGGTETVTTLHFKECKPMIFGKKNFKTVLLMTKKVDVDDWKGLKIELFILENQKAFGELWDVIRVSPTKPVQAKAVDYTEQHLSLKSCTTLEQLQKVYTAFSREQQVATVATKDKMKQTLTPPQQ